MAIPCVSSDAVIKNFSFSIFNFSFRRWPRHSKKGIETKIHELHQFFLHISNRQEPRHSKKGIETQKEHI